MTSFTVKDFEIKKSTKPSYIQFTEADYLENKKPLIENLIKTKLQKNKSLKTLFVKKTEEESCIFTTEDKIFPSIIDNILENSNKLIQTHELYEMIFNQKNILQQFFFEDKNLLLSNQFLNLFFKKNYHILKNFYSNNKKLMFFVILGFQGKFIECRNVTYEIKEGQNNYYAEDLPLIIINTLMMLFSIASILFMFLCFENLRGAFINCFRKAYGSCQGCSKKTFKKKEEKQINFSRLEEIPIQLPKRELINVVNENFENINPLEEIARINNKRTEEEKKKEKTKNTVIKEEEEEKRREDDIIINKTMLEDTEEENEVEKIQNINYEVIIKKNKEKNNSHINMLSIFTAMYIFLYISKTILIYL